MNPKWRKMLWAIDRDEMPEDMQRYSFELWMHHDGEDGSPTRLHLIQWMHNGRHVEGAVHFAEVLPE